jgi:hypothetical protein
MIILVHISVQIVCAAAGISLYTHVYYKQCMMSQHKSFGSTFALVFMSVRLPTGTSK